MKAMRKYTTEAPKVETHSFVNTRTTKNAYAFKGSVKTYSNKTQAENAKVKLEELGFSVYVSFSWPHLLIKND